MYIDVYMHVHPYVYLTYVYAPKNMKLLYILHTYLSARGRVRVNTCTYKYECICCVCICIHICVYICMYMYVWHVTWIYTSCEQIHGVYIARNIYKCTTILRRCMRVSDRLDFLFLCRMLKYFYFEYEFANTYVCNVQMSSSFRSSSTCYLTLYYAQIW